MSTSSLITFSVLGVSTIVGLYLTKRARYHIDLGSSSSADMSEFLDWIEDIPGSPVNINCEQYPHTPIGDHTTFRALAAVGLAATAPRDARQRPPKGGSNIPHPASGNDDIADEVVRVERVSEEEEAERYFSAFSFYKD
jgi:hypothetical protein